MAVKRLDPNATFDIVTLHDEALFFETNEELKAQENKNFEEYLQTFDLTKLKFKENEKPDLFRVRCLRVEEMAQINEKYVEYDVVNKQAIIKNKNNMLVELFKLGCLGIVEESGAIKKIGVDELEFKVILDIGASISLLGTLGKNLKKA